MSESPAKAKDEDSVKKTTTGKVQKYADNILPMARIKKIMRMDPNITDGISVEANYLICAATEMFIRKISKEVYEREKSLTYSSLASLIQSDDKLDFLHAVVPDKITIKKYKEIIAEEEEKLKQASDGSDLSSSSEEEDASDDEEESASEAAAEPEK